MTIALLTIGWWLYVDLAETPQAVVVCVIIYNAAFGYRYEYKAKMLDKLRLFKAGVPYHGFILLK